jgi:hypothetical protein
MAKNSVSSATDRYREADLWLPHPVQSLYGECVISWVVHPDWMSLAWTGCNAYHKRSDFVVVAGWSATLPLLGLRKGCP